MKALVKYASGPGNLGVRDVDEPVCGPTQVKVRVAFCGVCGTDLHVRDDTFRNFPPVILGHEFSGTVADVGRDVTGVSVGERVAVLGATAVRCGTCTYCRSGYFIFCRQRRGMGHGVNGAFASHVVVRPDQLFRLPPEVSLEEGALTEPLAAAVQAVAEVTTVRPGDRVLVSGPGPMGLLCVKVLVAHGVRPLVAGAADDEARLAAAVRFGAAGVVNVGRESLAEAVWAFTAGQGVDVAFECAGHPASVRGCLESLRPLGQYTQVAICGREVPFPIDQVFYKQLTVRGSVTYTADTWDRVMRLHAGGGLRLQELVSEVLPLEEWERAFALCETRRALKVLLRPPD
ncbi:MAG TPA: alcohol dehydrogenase catalytic domain-containing protein [Vicinamibacterales bacterium]